MTRDEAIKLGLKRYSDGRRCRNGHLSLKTVRRNMCVECLRAREKRYASSYSDNPPPIMYDVDHLGRKGSTQ
jgi:hypothetical protein